MYLIYTTEQEAWDRSEQEGIRIGLAYHTHCCGSRYATAPRETADGGWALDVSSYKLDEVEEATTVSEFTPKPVPEGEL